MKRFIAITVCCLLFSSALFAGKGDGSVFSYPDSLRSVWLYTEGIKQNAIFGDSLRAKELFREAVQVDSTCAPAYYELVANGMYSTPEEAVELAGAAHRLDTTNKWYHRFYGQTLIYAQRYKEAQRVFRKLCTTDPQDPDNYRLLAALYEQNDDPYMAIATLDSAELRFGRTPFLSVMKRRLLVGTNQIDKAITEARALVDAAPYEAQNLAELADLYGRAKKDSLALDAYRRALAIDSTNVTTLMSMADFHAERHDYRALLDLTRRLFASETLPLDAKIKRFEQFTSDRRFYREFYPQINNLAMILAIRYPDEHRIVELYANHLIASGELPQALALYKSHLDDQPPSEEFFRTVIDIESYLQHPDSVNLYVDRALKLFPEKADFHMSKGHVMGNLKQYDRAIKAYKESLRFAHTDSLRGVIWGMIGDVWHLKATGGTDTQPTTVRGAARKAMSECYKSYDRSLRYNGDNPLVMNNYAYFLAEENRDLEKALSLSSRVVAMTDNNPTYLDTHAWVLFKLGRAAEAKKTLQQAIALDRQGSPELLVHYGDILHALGEAFLAETYWRKALEKGYDATRIARRIEQANASKE